MVSPSTTRSGRPRPRARSGRMSGGVSPATSRISKWSSTRPSRTATRSSTVLSRSGPGTSTAVIPGRGARSCNTALSQQYAAQLANTLLMGRKGTDNRWEFAQRGPAIDAEGRVLRSPMLRRESSPGDDFQDRWFAPGNASGRPFRNDGSPGERLGATFGADGSPGNVSGDGRSGSEVPNVETRSPTLGI